jgi:glycosyltransferase involved in cell wall biosynthesis
MLVRLVKNVQANQGTGIGTYIDNLCRALADHDVNVDVSSFRYLPGSDWRPALKLLPIGVFSERKADVIHLPQIAGASVLLGRRLGPTVVTAHDLGVWQCPEDRIMVNRFGRELLRLSLRGMRKADHIITVSHYTREGLLRMGFTAERVTAVHLGVDHSRFYPQRNRTVIHLRQKYGLASTTTKPMILYVGNELPRKNLQCLIRALFEIKNRGLAFEWIKIGKPIIDKSRYDLLRMIESYGLTEEVSIIDYVDDDDLPLFYSAASVYVQPGGCEGFGLPVLEAMACGTPVVAARAGALPEVCDDAAVLVDAYHAPSSLAGAIAAVLTDADLSAKLVDLSVRRAAEFTWENAAKDTAELYKRVIFDER